MKKRTTILMIATLALILLSVRTFADQPIKGTVTYHDDPNNPVPSTLVKLLNLEGNVIDETYTNFNGKYIFPNKPYGYYYVQAVETEVAPGGVELDDAAMIQAFLDGDIDLTDIQELAADANNDGTVDSYDIEEIENNWNNPNFEPAWVYEEAILVNHNGTKTNVPTMGGSSSGDVNGTFVPTGRNEAIALVEYFQKNFSSVFTIEVYASDIISASAMGLIIDYPAGVNINNVTSQLGELKNLKIKNNQIVATWSNQSEEAAVNSSEPVLVISASTNQSYNGSDIRFQVNNKSHFVTNGQAFKPEFSVPFLSVNGTDNLSFSYPNPASESTVIYFTLPEAAKANLNIYNINGQLVKNIMNEEMSAGQHSVNLSVTDLKEGVYFYNLTTSGNVNINQAKRLVVVH